MSLRAQGSVEVPVETARIARAAFPKGSLAIRLRDELGSVFTDEQFAGLFPTRGKPAWSPGRLALIAVLQFAEGLRDRQAAEAVRARIDWKYALNLELTDPGFDHSVLSEFRDRLVAADAGGQLLDQVLEAARGAGLLRPGGRARTDATHVLASIRALKRLEFVIETVRAALNALAAAAPQWLTVQAEEAWFDRYVQRVDNYWLPKKPDQRALIAETTGVDGMSVLRQVFATDAPVWLRELPAVELLRRAWVQQYFIDAAGQVRWRDAKDCPTGTDRLVSPYDDEARFGKKRDIRWDGFKVHLTETCEPTAPHLITHVLTTTAPVADDHIAETVHAGLAERGLLPDEHWVDNGYCNAGAMVTARREYGVDLQGPVARNTTAQAGGSHGLDAFVIDWDKHEVTCPAGHTNIRWAPGISQQGLPVIRVRFSKNHCTPCPDLRACTSSPTSRNREMTLRQRDEHQLLREARALQGTDDWNDRYKIRAGIEGTISQGVHVFGLRRSRYRGLAKTTLQHQLTATAINLVRIDAWLSGQPHAHTRISHLAALRPAS